MNTRAIAFVLGSFCTIAACAAPSGDTEEVGQGADEIVEAKHLGMTDVTVLYPLPRTAEYYDDLMSPSSEGERGELFAPEVFEQLKAVKAPPMFGNDGTPTDPKAPLFATWADQFANLRVVGVRLDPCFGETVGANMGAATCQNTIRLIAQFVDPANPTSVDSRVGIHLFYTITRLEFTTLLKGMLALRKQAKLPIQKGFIHLRGNATATLTNGFGVSPVLMNEGLRGVYATGLRDLLLTYAGAATLSQVAFCVQDRGGEPNRAPYYGEANVMSQTNRWAFGRFDVRQGNIYAQNVATLNFAGVQVSDIEPTVDRTADGTPKRALLMVAPAPQTPETFFPGLNEPQANIIARDAASKVALNFLNPAKYTARNADCVTCHLADQATNQRSSSLFTQPTAFKSNTWRLNHTPTNAGPFRMMGWVATGNSEHPGSVMGSRVVNETAVVLDYVNKNLLK
jgi:hypothetical protein